MNKLPPLNAMNAFARVAQTGSFAEAAKTMNVTPAAVSQQVRRLEHFLETKLVPLPRSGKALHSFHSAARVNPFV